MFKGSDNAPKIASRGCSTQFLRIFLKLLVEYDVKIEAKGYEIILDKDKSEILIKRT